MITVECLNKRFSSGRRRPVLNALEDVSFHAPDGRITALLGPNGAGKTTTLRIIATLMRADGGVATVGGLGVTDDPIAVRRHLGVLSDARGLYVRLTARENVLYHADLRGVPRAQANRQLDRLAALLDMTALLDRRTGGFSTGEKMKVALARALIHAPGHLILDEPTNGLDVMSTRALRHLLLHLRDDGCCILFSTHVMQEVEQLCDDIVVLSRGRSVAHGTASQLRADTATETLEDAFVKLALTSEAACL